MKDCISVFYFCEMLLKLFSKGLFEYWSLSGNRVDAGARARARVSVRACVLRVRRRAARHGGPGAAPHWL